MNLLKDTDNILMLWSIASQESLEVHLLLLPTSCKNLIGDFRELLTLLYQGDLKLNQIQVLLNNWFNMKLRIEIDHLLSKIELLIL